MTTSLLHILHSWRVAAQREAESEAVGDRSVLSSMMLTESEYTILFYAPPHFFYFLHILPFADNYHYPILVENGKERKLQICTA
jgi:hypothetical protein